MRRGKHDGMQEIEAIVYRLFAEKQFALALLALVMVAQLLSAQFLLLRLSSPSSQSVSAPALSQRVDVRCGGEGARLFSGEPITSEGARGKVVVVHLGATGELCLSQVSAASPAELVVGMGADAQPGR